MHELAETEAGSIAEQAAAWIVLLSADDASEREHARIAFEQWQQLDPQHAKTAACLQTLLGQLQDLRASSVLPARSAIVAALVEKHRDVGGKRRAAALALLCIVGLSSWLMLQTYPLPYLLADVRTVSGQWQTQTLSDGSRITLNGASAVNLHFDEQARELQLLQGEVLVDVAKDNKRPFVVKTAEGSIRALGTSFLVRQDTGITTLSMLESQVLVQPVKNGQAGQVVVAGQGLRFQTDHLDAVTAVDVGSVADAWKYHQLVVQDKPLTEVLDELKRHRRGHIRYDRQQLANIRVSAVLPLDDTDRALQLLLNNFPDLRIRTRTSYLVVVDKPADKSADKP